MDPRKVRESLIKQRADKVKRMHEFVLHLYDEDYYMWWIMVVPDEPTQDDFEFIAEDEESYKEVSDLFKRLIASYVEKYGVLD